MWRKPFCLPAHTKNLKADRGSSFSLTRMPAILTGAKEEAKSEAILGSSHRSCTTSLGMASRSKSSRWPWDLDGAENGAWPGQRRREKQTRSAQLRFRPERNDAGLIPVRRPPARTSIFLPQHDWGHPLLLRVTVRNSPSSSTAQGLLPLGVF